MSAQPYEYVSCNCNEHEPCTHENRKIDPLKTMFQSIDPAILSTAKFPDNKIMDIPHYATFQSIFTLYRRGCIFNKLTLAYWLALNLEFASNIEDNFNISVTELFEEVLADPKCLGYSHDRINTIDSRLDTVPTTTVRP